MIANLLLQAVDTIDEGDIFIAAFLVKYIIDTLDQWFPNNLTLTVCVLKTRYNLLFYND